MDVIYSKYSNDRAKEYQIRTDIVVKDNRKVVVKRPACEEARGHIKKIYKNYCDLSNCFKGTNLTCNVATLCEEGVEIEFLRGITLEEQLDGLLNNGRLDEFKKSFQRYLDVFGKISNKRFEVTQQYEETFGTWKLTGDYSCMPVTDIDIIFPNIIVENDKWTVIDYEWTFDFPIPSKYVLYRTILYYLSEWKNKILDGHIDMYEMAGITNEEKEYFWGAEWVFQSSISKGYISLANVNNSMNTKKYHPFSIAADKYANDKKRLGYALLYSESHIIDKRFFEPGITEEGHCVYQFDVSGYDIEKIEIFPFNDSCRLSINAIVLITHEGNKGATYNCNGQSIGNNKWAFFEKPCITIDCLKDEIEAVFFEYDVKYERPKELMKNVLWEEHFVNIIEEQYNQIIGLHEEKKIIEEEFSRCQNSLEQITNSKSWRMIEKIRKIKSKIIRGKV